MDLLTFARDPENLAVRLPAEDVFSVLARRLSLPPDFAALVRLETGSSEVVAAGGTVEGRGVRELLAVRVAPLTIEFDECEVESADGFECRARLRLAAAVVAERSDLEAFARTIVGSSRRANVRRINLHLDDAVRKVLHAFARQHPAEDLVASVHDDAFTARLLGELQPLAFPAGLKLSRPVTLEVVSPGLEEARRARRQAEAAERRRTEAARLQEQHHAERQKHVDRIADLAARLGALARDRPNVTAAELVRTFEPVDRDELYRHLLAGRSHVRATPAVAVVAGNELLLLDPESGEVALRRGFDGRLGPLRSVRVQHVGGRLHYLVGAGRGVHLVDPQGQGAVAFAFDPPRPLRGGVNASVLLDDALYATHSEVGVLRWMRTAPQSGRVILAEHTAGAAAVRDIQADEEGALWFTAGDRVIGWSPARSSAVRAATLPASAAPAAAGESPAEPADPQGTLVSVGSISGARGAPRVAALYVNRGWVFAGTSDGRLLAWPGSDPQSHETLLAGEGGSVESVQLVSWAGVEYVVVASRRPYATVLVRHDVFRLEFRADEPIRWAAAAEDWVLGVNDRRDRVHLWRPERPERVERTLFVGRTVGHAIQDALLVPPDAG